MHGTDRSKLAQELGLASGTGRGLVERDQDTHAVMPGPDGATARCAAGPILRRLPGLFDGSDPLACPNCVELQLADYHI